tara:strand:- start:249 stop:494 length:246 start_codon:yes stop_codon:yes gene_type:complete
MKQEEVKREIEFRLVDDEDMPPIVITIGENDLPKVVINRHYTIWLTLYRKCIGGCAESMFEKIDELLTAHLSEQRIFERME